MTSQGGPWRVFGRVAGQHLPTVPVRIGAVTLGPLPQGVRGVERVHAPTATPPSDTYYVSRGSDLEVQSQCYFWIDVMAESAEGAILRVQEDEAPRLQVALTLGSTNVLPHYVEAVWALGNGEVISAPSAITGVAYWYPERLDGAHLSLVQDNYRILGSNQTARNAADSLSSAIAQQAKAGDATGQASALLTYFKVIEIIANSAVTEPPQDRGQKQAEILLKLERNLRSKKDVKKKVQAVSEAEKAFSRLEKRYLSLRIAAASDRLALPQEWTRAAVQLTKLRNTTLSHPGRSLSHEDRIRWFGTQDDDHAYSGHRLAREVLCAYVNTQRGPTLTK